MRKPLGLSLLDILLLILDKAGILTLNETHLQWYYKGDIFFQILVYLMVKVLPI